MNGILDFLIQFYGLLLKLYPASFRGEFAEQMLLDFSDLAADARARGRVSLLLFFLREFIDFPMNLIRVHMQEKRMSNLIRSQPISFGLRGALGFGIVFALTVPIGSLIYDKLFFWLDAFVSHLRVAYFEPRFTWLLWLPAIFNTIVGGLVFGLVVAILFAGRDQRRKYFFYGAFGWFMYQAVITALTSHSFWELLNDTQVVYFSLLIRALVGAIFGMILVISSSERSHTMRWLVACLIGLPLFAWLSMYQLINGSAFPTPWRVAGVFTLILGMIVIVLAVTRKLDDKGRSWIASAGMLAFPVAVILSSGIYLLIFPSVPRYTSTIDMFHLATSSAFRGALFGLLLGIIMGFQSKGKLPVFLFSN